MKCKIEKSTLTGIIQCPPNKSYTHRAVFLAALAGNPSTVKNALYSDDTNATIGACKALGAQFEQNNDTLKVVQKLGVGHFDSKIDAANSGTTIRIAAAISSLFEKTTILSGDDSLKKRPMQYLIDCLEKMGAKCKSNDGKPPLEITGKIKGGNIAIPGNISSQFISALFITGPLTEIGINLKIEGELVSKPYVDATIASMKKFGVNVDTVIPYKEYKIPNQQYTPTTFDVPSDFSSLALLLAAVILVGDNLKIKVNINELPQGDRYFLDIINQLGVDTKITDDLISINTPTKLRGGRFDLSNTPDLLPPLSTLILKSENPIEIFNVKHARFKETDRIAIISRELKKIGVSVEERDDGMILNPSTKYSGGELLAENDHRLFMAFCIIGMFIGNCSVTDPESVSVSYPDFVAKINSVGGKIISK